MIVESASEGQSSELKAKETKRNGTLKQMPLNDGPSGARRSRVEKWMKKRSSRSSNTGNRWTKWVTYNESLEMAKKKFPKHECG